MGVPRGKAQTVLGVFDPSSLGITLMHEHLFIDITRFCTQPTNPRYLKLARQPIMMENLGWIRVDPDRHYDNLILGDENRIVSEVLHFKASGGDTIVDLTPPDIGRDPIGLQRVARRTGLKIICGTSHYQKLAHPDGISSKSVGDITNEFVKDITEGIGDTGVKAGIIGEVGNSIPWSQNERKCCAAAAKAQQETGAPISIHPAPTKESPFEIARLLKKEGANLERVVMGHTDARFTELEEFERMADLGCYVELDMFGLDRLRFGDADGHRIKIVAGMIDHGYVNQVLIAHDICVKSQLKTYGGHGYDHILENILPVLRTEGISNKEINQIMVENPARVLAFS